MLLARSRLRESQLLPATLLGVVVAVAVTLPWWTGQPILLLDWVLGSQTPILPRRGHGLDGGLTAGLPMLMGAPLLERVFGPVATWLPLALVFPMASAGMARLLRALGAGQPGMLAAALLYSVNPWVLDRIAVGHLALLVGYAVLPWFVVVILRDLGGGWRSAGKAGLLFALMIGASIHWFWVAGLVIVVAAVALGQGARGIAWALATIGAAALCSAYLLIGSVAAGSSRRLPDEHDLVAYQSAGSSLTELAGHLVSLQGFWRPLPQQPVYLLPAWPLLWLGILLVIGVGYARLLRGRHVRVGALLAAVSVAGLLLSFGQRGPLGPVFEFAFDHLPGFRVMREPQKFDALLTLGYAVGFGVGAEKLLDDLRSWRRAAGATLLAALVCAVAFSMFWGINGSIRPSTVPPSLAAADRAMTDKDGTVLVLPWHLYLAFPWTQGRVVANPALALLDQPLISGDNAELQGVPEQEETDRSTAVRRLLADGPEKDVLDQLQELQVRYVLLLHGGTWPSYSWLGTEPGLRSVPIGPGAELWEVPSHGESCDLRHISTTKYGARCSGSELVLPEPFDSGWRLDGSVPRATSAGLTAFDLSPTQRETDLTVRYAGARTAQLLLWASGLAAFLLITSLIAPWWAGRVAHSYSRKAPGP